MLIPLIKFLEMASDFQVQEVISSFRCEKTGYSRANGGK
jgi:hypothetical protein